MNNFTAFNGQVNIVLFNDIVEFVAGTAANAHDLVLHHLKTTHLWYAQTSNENIQRHYGFRYFGELLERYEERFGSNIADIRAIALAMAYTKDLLTDEMFVGRQKSDFLRKIKKLSRTDVFLKGALYRLRKDETDVSGLLNDLAQTTYSKPKSWCSSYRYLMTLSRRLQLSSLSSSDCWVQREPSQ